MKRFLYLFAALLLIWGCGSTTKVPGGKIGKSYVIGFYNLENLFDTYHDEGKNDYEYLPDGANEWTEAKYAKKLQNMAHVIDEMHKDNGAWHAVLGVSEIENRHVLEDLVAEPAIAAAAKRNGTTRAVAVPPPLLVSVMSPSVTPSMMV